MPEPYPFPDEFSPVGSTVFYAIRFAPSDRHADLSLVNAFYRTVKSIPFTCSDPGVAAEKLNWWQLEMQRSRQSQAQHPIARSMGTLQIRHNLPEDYFTPFFQAVGQEIGSIVVENDVDLEVHCRHTGGLFADLNAVVGNCNDAQRSAARELGEYLRMVEILRDLGKDLRQNRCFIPRDRLKRHQLSPTQLLDSDSGERLNELLSSLGSFQQQRYRKTLQEISLRDGLGPVLGMAAMAERVLRIIHADGYRRLLRQRTSLTPLHKLWISWRCQRRIG